MMVFQVMCTNMDSQRLPQSVRAQDKVTDYADLDPSFRYEVVDNAEEKVSEVEGELLVFLARSAGRLHLDTVVNAMEDGVVVIDDSGRICYQNDAYARIVGVPMR